MAEPIVMPQMGAEMEEGAVARWRKQPGDHIARGDVIAEIETDKATVDLESFSEGYFLGSVVGDGLKVPVGTVIAYYGAQGEAVPNGGAVSPAATAAGATAALAAAAPAAPAAAEAALPPDAPAPSAPAPEVAPAPVASAQTAAPLTASASMNTARAAPSTNTATAAPTAPAPGAAPAAPPRASGERLRASPLARNIAQDLGVDLTQVRGSGPDGRIMRRDVEEAAKAVPAPAPAPISAPATPAEAQAQPAPSAPAPAAAPAAAPADGTTVEALSPMRRAIARRMAAAKREIPHYYLTMSVDMTDALALRRQINGSVDESERVSVNDFIIKACAAAIAKHPRFNAAFTDEGIQQRSAVNIGIAVALPDGLVVPALLNCESKSLGAIARNARDAAERARAGHLRQAELSDGTFSISNLGMYGVETLVAIIQPGQAAILGVGAVESRPVVREGQIVVREVMIIALSADHRVTDGAQGAQFLAEIKAQLEHPMRLLL